MKIGDFVKVRKMKKSHKWNDSFGVLFTGLIGKIENDRQAYDGRNLFVTFEGERGTGQMNHFHEKELKLVFEEPVCKDMKPLKNPESVK